MLSSPDRNLPRAFRTPSRPQFQTTECGVAVLRIVLSHFGKHVSAREMRQRSGVSRDCLTAAEMRRAAVSLGLTCRAFRREPDDIGSMPLPCVVHLRFFHFVVVEAITDGHVRVNCPAAGRQDIPRAQFAEDFTGIALTFVPNADFSRQPIGTSAELGWWKIFGAALAARLLLSAAFAAAGAVAMVFAILRIGSPAGIDSPDKVSGAALALGIAAAGAFSARAVLRMASFETQKDLRGRLLSKLTRLPFAFFSYRKPGVLVDVVQSSQTLASAVTERFGHAVNGMAQLAVFLLAALLLAPATGAAFCGIALSWALAAVGLGQWRRRLERLGGGGLLPDAAVLADALQHPESAKLSDATEQLRQRLSSQYATRQLGRLRMGLVPQITAVLPLLAALAAITAAILLYASAQALELVLIGGCIGTVIGPAGQLRGAMERLRRQAISVRDILDEADVAQPRAGPTSVVLASDALKAEDISFAFAPGRPDTLRRVTFSIEVGQQIGITGPPGSGKSTLAQVLAGLFEPRIGQVSAGGISLNAMSGVGRAGAVALVDRFPVLFKGTIRDNLTLYDAAIGEDALRDAVRDAGLDDVIASRAGGLDAPVAEFGSNFSGGQIQRLEIARALARNPRVVILDDAVDALDVATEMHIRVALQRRGCAIIVISQRAETLQRCDRVLVCENGRLQLSSTGAVRDDGEADHRVSFLHQTRNTARAEGGSLSSTRIVDCMEALTGVRCAASAPLAGDRAAAVESIAAALGWRCRRVRFIDPGWWFNDIGRVIAFRQDGQPVALVHERGRTLSVDPATAQRVALDRATIATLDATAFALDAPAGHAPGSLADWMRTVHTTSLVETLWAVLALAGLCLVATVLLLAAAGNLDHRTVGAMAGLCVSAALFFAVFGRAAMRFAAKTGANATETMVSLVGTIEADVSSRLTWGQCFQSCTALLRLTDLSIAAVGLPLLAVVSMTVAVLALGAWAGVFFAVAAFGGCMGLIALECAGGRLVIELDRNHANLQIAARRRLASAMWGMSRLLTLGAAPRVLQQYANDDDKALQLAWRLAVTDDVVASLRLAATVALTGTLTWMGAAPTHAAVVAALAWFAAIGAQDCGAFIGRSIRERAQRRQAPDLLVLARESGAHLVDTATAKITLREVSCSYPGSAPVLQNLSLTLDPSLCTVISGPSGSGKSTLLRLLLGLKQPSAGEVLIGGVAVDAVDRAHWRGRIAGVFQGIEPDQGTTIRAFLTGFAQIGLDIIWEVLAAMELAHDIARMPMGLQTIIESRTLSGSQQQRLLIARALVRRPVLLVLDEATNAIDDAMLGRLIAWLRQRRIGCIVVTHRPALTAMADQCIVIERGELVSNSAHSQQSAE